MAEQRNSGLLSQGKGLDPFINRFKQAYEQQGALGAIAQAGGGLLDLLQLGGTMAVNEALPILYGPAEAERRRLEIPYLERSATAREMADVVARSEGRLPPVRRQDVQAMPGPVSASGTVPSVEQRVAADRAFREDLTRRGQGVTPAAEIDRTGGMTGAEAYMQEAARLREAEKQQEAAALKQKMDRDNATGTPNIMPYVLAGDNQAQNARERSFLERMSQSGLLSTLQGMARAERMYGVGPLAAFSESALDVQAARSAAEQKQREMGLELAKERLKAGDGGADYRKALGTTQVQNLLQSAGSTFGTINTIAEINKFLGANQVSGAVASAEKLATQLGNLFGLNLDTASQETVSNLADMIKASLAESRLFGRDLSKADYQILAQIIQKPGLWTSNKTLVNQYKRVAAKMAAAHSRKVRSLVDIFGGGAIGQQRAQRLLSTQPAVTSNLFTEVKQ